MDELRILKKTVLKAEWDGKMITIAPKPFREIEDVLKEMDKLAEQATGIKTGSADYWQQMFQKNETDLVKFLRFFVALPDECDDKWVHEHLDLQVLTWLIDMVKEVNKFDFIKGFFLAPGALTPARR